MNVLLKYRLEIIALILIALYASVLGYFYLGLNAYVPDEMWFQILAKSVGFHLSYDHSWAALCRVENRLGYGSLYWILNGWLTHRGTINGMPWMRLVGLVSAVAIPCLYVWRAWYQKKSFIWPVLLWLIFPAAWWFGKITGPELLSQALGLGGVVLLLNSLESSKRFVGISIAFFVLGIAMGIKLSVMPLLIFAGLSLLLSNQKNIISLICVCIIVFIIAYIVSNPILINDPSIYIEKIKEGTIDDGYGFWAHLKRIFISDYYDWDLVFVGGFFNWAVSIVSTLIFLVWCFFQNVPRRKWIIFGTTFLLTAGAFLFSKRFLGWYWFPFIMLMPLVLLEGRKKLSFFQHSAFLGLIIIFSLGNIKHTILRAQSKVLQGAIINEIPTVRENLAKLFLTKKIKVDSIYDLLDFTKENLLPPKAYHDYFRSHEVTGVISSGGDFKGKLILFVVGKRIAKSPRYSKFIAMVDNNESYTVRGNTFKVFYREHHNLYNIYILLKG